MIGVGPGDRLGAPGLSGSAYDPRFGSTLGTAAYGACIRIHHCAASGRQRSFPSPAAGRTPPDHSLIWNTSSKSSLITSVE
jgi:hypothetical protein